MTSAFKTVLDTAKAALLQSPAIAGGRVYVGRDLSTPLDAASDVNLTLQAQDGSPFAIGDGPTDWVIDLGVEIRARGSDIVDAVAAIDPLIEAAYARLAAIAWPAGVMGITALRGQLDSQEAATPVAGWQFVMSINIRTAPGSLALAP